MKKLITGIALSLSCLVASSVQAAQFDEVKIKTHAVAGDV